MIPMGIEITINPNEELALKIKKQIDNNGGFCISQPKDKSTKCICQDFIDNVEMGFCKCGLYIKRQI